MSDRRALIEREWGFRISHSLNERQQRELSHLLSIQVVGNALETTLELRVYMDGDDHLFSGGSQAEMATPAQHRRSVTTRNSAVGYLARSSASRPDRADCSICLQPAINTTAAPPTAGGSDYEFP
ncbi:hypothetical protein EVAR_47044_1 [Eumeta japonica]|uniref:Uncharacterized protein n=1 Tax=Eumeta variegata TaxID=151549 RepID=A0A4C1XK08_EUMVA|nr:hypothetical protein EVAR_47044_1 [Eumeta japonica]